MNNLPKFVFSRRLNKAEWGRWNNVKLIQENAAEVVGKLKQETGKIL
jgi:hypothetical protein